MPPTISWFSNRNFGIVIDAGSSGSRVQIYSWKEHGFIRQGKNESELHILPTIERGDEFGLNWQLKVEPGISTFATNPAEVGELHLKRLLDFAKQVVPSDEITQTPIYLLATAGMRLLPSSQQQAILQNACDYIMFNYVFKIDKCSDHVQVISGEWEGIYGWLAVNYLMNGFYNDSGNEHMIQSQKLNNESDNSEIIKHTTTYGFLDMGGASTQIAFEPNSLESKKHADDLTKVTLYTLDGKRMDYDIFVTTFLGFGTNEARRRYIEENIRKYTATHEKIANPESSREQPTVLLKDPCLPVNLFLTDTSLPPPYYTLQGIGSFNQCLEFTYPLLNKTATCLDDPCLFNGVHTPKIDFSVNHFIGISEYWYSTHDVFGLGGIWNFSEFEKKANDYCAREWDNIVNDYYKSNIWGKEIDLTRLEMQCFKAAWIVNVLHEGIGVPRIIDNVMIDSDNKLIDKVKKTPPFQSINNINDVQVSWTLGKMVMEASGTIPLLWGPHPHPPPQPQGHGLFGYYNYLVEWMIGISILAILLIFIWFTCLRKNGIGKGRRMSIGFLHFLSSMRRGARDGGPDYGRLEGGQYPSAGFSSWRIVNNFNGVVSYFRWKFLQLTSPFRRFFNKKGDDSSEDVSVTVASGNDGEEMKHFRQAPSIDVSSNSVVTITETPATPILEKGSSPTEQTSQFSPYGFPSTRYKKRLSGDSIIPNEVTDKGFSTPINLSLTGLQSRNSSLTNLGKFNGRSGERINASSISLGQSGSNNGGFLNDSGMSLSSNTNPNYSLGRGSKSTTNLGWMEDEHDDKVAEYETADSILPNSTEQIRYQTTSSTRPFSFPSFPMSTTSSRNSTLPTINTNLGHNSNNSSTDMSSASSVIAGTTGLSRPNSRAGRNLSIDKTNRLSGSNFE
ncbi:nucleoside phosphatase family-domain-containing protein [Glomus cerebriforme]|uniref:Nucleoside phosphatase family-domain-containing protein n=1 Tax=Glomus cerebriforme TaxID=658196 RepID=A0A397SD53_9GLOM|nr:nucleoside phosphatase family-domain-containing protein [Glomus cerebriforme]RIA90336.1 nucleoside phosphatase family-domain-containing protein [Glomus cerebriforme]